MKFLENCISQKIKKAQSLKTWYNRSANITYHESLQIIVEAMLATIQEEFHITDEQVNAFYEKFMTKLPESMQHLLQAAW